MRSSLRMSLPCAVAVAGILATSTAVVGAQVGVWQFNNSLTNEIGGKAPLSVLGAWSPTYVSETIGGSPATVLSFPKFDTTQAISMPNQGAVSGPIRSPSTNNWSIVMDVNFPAIVNWTSIWETGEIGGNDGDYFINPSRAIGIGSYSGAFPENTWTRLAVTVDSATTPGTYTIKGYLDGVLTSTSTSATAPGGREGIREFLHLFADEDFETSGGLLNSVAFYGATLDDAAVGALGTATADGVPAAENQAGRWDFNNNLNNAIGGRAPMTAVGGWTPFYESVEINGSPATALSFPAFDNTQALDMPNEAGFDVPALSPAKTNVWSIVMDVKFPTLSGFTSIFNTDSLENADGEYFIRDDSGAGAYGSIGISGNYQGIFSSDAWTRLAVTVDGSVEGAYRIAGYIDGVPVGTAVSTGAGPDGRFAIDDVLNLFNDTDDVNSVESSAGFINSLAYYDELLTPEAIAELGAASAAGITATAPSTDADFDNNNVVDGADFLIWQRGFGITSNATNSQGDADLNGTVDAADLALWKGSFGGSAVAGVAAVPEPQSLAMAALAMGALSLSMVRTGGNLRREIDG